MALKDDLNKEVATIFRSQWTTRDGTVVPEYDSVKLGNDAVKLKATVLYADLADSTKMVDNHVNVVAAECYKAFLHCAAKIIRAHDGAITAYDGDRIMAVYIGDSMNSRAVRTALKINYAVREIVNPALTKQYAGTSLHLKHVVGVDTSDLFVARTGVRGANDLVWVGRAANYAAKLSALPHSHNTYITEDVFKVMADDCKTGGPNKTSMWEAVKWNTFDDRIIYRSNWTWRVT